MKRFLPKPPKPVLEENEVLTDYRETLKGMSSLVACSRKRPKQKIPCKNGKRTRKAKHLPIDQIRKEYGVMSKPGETMAQNILLLFFISKGQKFRLSQISSEIKAGIPSVSAILSRLRKAGVISYEKVPVDGIHRAFYYVSVDETRDVEKLYTDFKAGIKGTWKRKPKEQKPLGEHESGAAPGTQELLDQAFGKEITHKVRVVVEGKINISFGWEK